MPRRLWVLTTKEELSTVSHPGIMVVMDVLLATTTILAAVENGAQEVRVRANLEEALALRRERGPLVILGGEQDGMNQHLFDFDHHPRRYRAEAVRGKTVLYVSTNGTRALEDAAKTQNPVLVSCLRNAPATARYLRRQPWNDLYLVCAGSRRQLSLEDFLCAGVILSELSAEDAWRNDAALVAEAMAQQPDVSRWLYRGRVGRWLVDLGWSDAVQYAGEVGASETVLRLDGDQVVPIALPD
ncbi:MAG: 2-phosphosulfolactate phosphatase [Firmicutes bacterium]|nr:2-phosphosulfolactate phosphatase [Bacillota bacterium]